MVCVWVVTRSNASSYIMGTGLHSTHTSSTRGCVADEYSQQLRAYEYSTAVYCTMVRLYVMFKGAADRCMMLVK
eukprot:COSAG01_NODE_3757_length_5723_cov_861.069701_2_plen_74_part_00